MLPPSLGPASEDGLTSEQSLSSQVIPHELDDRCRLLDLQQMSRLRNRRDRDPKLIRQARANSARRTGIACSRVGADDQELVGRAL